MAGPRGSQVPCWGLCHVLWGLCYVAAGAVQLVAGLFALYWLPVLGLGSNIITGTWNLLAGISCALMAGLATELNATRLEILLYTSISVLTINSVNLAILELFEWQFLVTEAARQEIQERSIDKLVCYARLSTSLSSALIVITALLDTHISFCVLHNIRARRRRAETNKPAPDPILNDMEYILPRRPTDLDDDEEDEHHHLTSQPNSAQAWVFDTGPVGGCVTEVTPCLRAEEPLSACSRPNTYLLSRTPQQSNKVVVKLEVPAYEDRTSLNFMRSFSRTPSPTCSLNHPIYESVDKRTATVSPRARLYTADYAYAVHRPGSSNDTARTHRRSESCDTRPHSVSSFHPPTVVSSTAATPSGKYQYASLMIELEQAIQNKKDGDESPAGSGSTDPSTLKDNSDTEFSKELEAALQMLQDLGSPNTIDTPSEPSRSITTESTSMPPSVSKNVVPVTLAVVHGEHSSRASSSGYSSPTLTGSMSHLYPPPPPLPGAVASSCSIRQDSNKTIISVFSPSAHQVVNNNPKGVTRVLLNPSPPPPITTLPPPAASNGWHFKIGTWGSRESSRSSSGIGHDYENMLLQTESLACLTELELLARHCRQKAEQRQIEHKVRRQLSKSNSVRKALKNTLTTYSGQQSSHV